MKNFDHIPLVVEKHAESWYSYPQPFFVPKGCYYRTDTDQDYRCSDCEETVELSCTGDWLEIVNVEEKRRIRHEIC